MPVVIALIRGINVGGHKKVKMAEFRDLFAALGMSQVRAILQSGNVVFKTEETDLGRLGELLEAGIRERFGFEAKLIMRTPEAFRAALAALPFDAQQRQEPGKVAVIFLSAAADPQVVEALRQANPGREVMQAAGNELYVFYTDGMARSKLDVKRIERGLEAVASARNWNTCQRLLKLLGEVEAQGNFAT